MNEYIVCVSKVHEKRGRVHGGFWCVLPGFCLQAQPPRWRCSAEPEASESELHSRDDPSYCLLTVRDDTHLKKRMPNANTFLKKCKQTYWFKKYIYIFRLCMRVGTVSREEKHHWGLTPQCFFSSQQSRPPGSECSDLNWWQWDWVRLEARTRSQQSSSQMTEPRPNQSTVCGATRQEPQL